MMVGPENQPEIASPSPSKKAGLCPNISSCLTIVQRTSSMSRRSLNKLRLYQFKSSCFCCLNKQVI